MKRTLTVLTLVTTMFSNCASAFNSDDLQKLLDTGNCKNCYLGFDKNTFKGVNLEGVNLEGADLEGASLAGLI
jgi:uncharacterized protein YjbI with pentapeptide repeats